MKKRCTESRNFTWSDGSSFDGFMNLIQHEPGFNNGNNDCVCVAMQFGHFIARSLNCFDEVQTICQKKGTAIIMTAESLIVIIMALLLNLRIQTAFFLL